MNKAFLVALREYMENLKTKAFWIGIMAFPIILVLAIAIPAWLEKKKDVRHYAVIDQTDWMLGEVDSRSAFPDLEKVLTEALEKYEKGGKDFEVFPEQIRELIRGVVLTVEKLSGPTPGEDALPEVMEQWEEQRDKKLQEALKVTAEEMTKATGTGGLKSTMAGALFPEETLDMAQEKFDAQFTKPIRNWYLELPSKEAEKYGSGLSKSRYARIDINVPTPVPPEKVEETEAKLKKMLNEDKLFAYFVVGPDPVGRPRDRSDQNIGSNGHGCKYVSNNLTDTDLKSWFTRHANAAIQDRRITQAEINENTAKWLREPLVFEAKKVSAAGVEEGVADKDTIRQWAPVVFVYLLWISIFTITQMLLTNTIEEKSNKIMEVLLSSVSPLQLMAGKIIGIAGTGLTMVVSWVFFFLVAIKYMPVLLGKGPPFDLTMLIRDPVFLGSFVAYFILGYLLLSAILVGIGSVCNSLKEAQNLMAPVTIILIVPLLAMVPIGQDPNGTIAKVLSYIPPFTPFVMMNRAAGPPSTMEYVVTTILLVVSIAFALWAAAKVFRVGILMTGKPPKLFEIFRWIRAPVGMVRIVEEEGEKK